mmetsp:Transcript_10775/g.32415  ORF Transcript_10775/g.32415 Transcript_10775/m.32415 type:complete len:240 (-) Transcript_10775:492-1211(-)
MTIPGQAVQVTQERTKARVLDSVDLGVVVRVVVVRIVGSVVVVVGVVVVVVGVIEARGAGVEHLGGVRADAGVFVFGEAAEDGLGGADLLSGAVGEAEGQRLGFAGGRDLEAFPLALQDVDDAVADAVVPQVPVHLLVAVAEVDLREARAVLDERLQRGVVHERLVVAVVAPGRDAAEFGRHAVRNVDALEGHLIAATASGVSAVPPRTARKTRVLARCGAARLTARGRSSVSSCPRPK